MSKPIFFGEMRPTSLQDLAAFMGCSYSSRTPLVRGAAIDSRLVQPGDLFFCLPGNRVAGHTFLGEAASRGAAAAVVPETYSGENFGLALLSVANVLLSLQELARQMLACSSSKVIAITGSMGKTTTKGFVATLLESSYHIYASPLSYNTQASLPLSILLAEGTEEYLILEMGMTHAGNLSSLVSIAPPDIALLTTVAMQHICNFPEGLEGIRREKCQIFSHPRTQLRLLAHEIDLSPYALPPCPQQTFSLHTREADFFALPLTEGVRVESKGEAPVDFAFPIPMQAHYQNFLAAISIARNLHVPWSVLQEIAPHLQLPPMRFERVEKQGIVFINDAFNANPDAMKAALESLPTPATGGRVVAVLGEMDALGIYSESMHRAVAETALAYVDELFCLGTRCEVMQAVWQRAEKPCHLFTARETLIESLQRVIVSGDVVLIKGPRTQDLQRILDYF